MPRATRRPRRTTTRRAAAPSVPEDLLWEILVRLPAKDLLRCRAVCRGWRRLATADDFLLAHHRLRPSLPFVSFHAGNHGEVADASVETFDLRRRRTPAERQPVLAFNDYSSRKGFTIHASCDGLILLSLANHRFYICNPATRQWAVLPGLTGGIVAALYLHRPSGEYRILFWKYTEKDPTDTYYVLAVGSEKLRCIGLPVASESTEPFMKFGISVTNQHPPLGREPKHYHYQNINLEFPNVRRMSGLFGEMKSAPH
uniref:F-box domain-containing protein n=1 Tax=Leersia perrieri TaxID=77586 RepID=A0A0D9W379_9ORYZ